MKVRINLYFDGASGTIDWRIVTKKDRVIGTSLANFSGNIESSHSFADHKQAQRDAIRFCELVGIQDAEFFDKSNLDEPELSF